MTFKRKFFLVVVSVISALIKGPSLEAAKLEFDGYVSRDKQSLRITATVEGTLEEIGEDEAMLVAKLQVYILDSNSSSPIIIGSNNTQNPGSGVNADFFYEHIEVPYREQISTSKYKAYYSIEVNNNTTSTVEIDRTLKQLFEDEGNTIRTQLKFLFSDNNTVDSAEKKLGLLTTVPNEAPSDFEVLAIHKGVRVNWAGNKSVSYTENAGEEPRSLRPRNVLVMVFPRTEADALPIAGALVNNESGEHSDINCLFSYSEGNDTCITCEEAESNDFFIKSSQEDTVTQEAFFKTEINNAANASSVVSGLDLEREYIAVLQYEDGTKRTVCKSVTPIETISLTELNGEDDGAEGDPRCFIASAAFGSPFAHEVRLFRWFRDTFLMPHGWGQDLVEFYYEHSPKLVEPMSHSEALRSAIRFLLWPIAWFLEYVKKLWEGELEALLHLLGLGGIFLVVVLSFRYRFNFPSSQ
ncbi:MAG: CFI-box-CTERM domain-containing protein [Oligoflexales bacterium]